MTCPSDESLARLADVEVPAHERSVLVGHLETCETCRRVVSGLLASSLGAPESAHPHLTLEPGAQLGAYLLTRRLGAGAMGTVFAAWDARLDRLVALKALTRAEAPGTSLVDEARLMARLSHPNVVTVFETLEWQGRVLLAMELVEGPTLREWLITPRRRKEILEVFVDAATGLAAAHDAGVVHRDFKPDNVLMAGGSRPRLTDFGLSRSLDPTVRDAPPALVGTPRYMAPEQLAGKQADERSDQFSFAAALWEALLGAPPFTGRTLRELAEAQGLKLRTTQLPVGLRRILGRALHQEPTSRFPSMHALRAALEAHQQRSKLVPVFGAAVLLTAALTSSWALTRQETPCAELSRRAGALAAAAPSEAFALAALAYQQAAQTCSASTPEAVECLREGLTSLESTFSAVQLAPSAAQARAPRLLAFAPAPEDCAKGVGAVGVSAPARVAAPRLEARLLEGEALHFDGAIEAATSLLAQVETEAAQVGHTPLVARAQLQRALIEGGLARTQDLVEWSRKAQVTAALPDCSRTLGWALLSERAAVCLGGAGTAQQCQQVTDRLTPLLDRLDEPWTRAWSEEQRTFAASEPMGPVFSRWRALPGTEPEQARVQRANLFMLLRQRKGRELQAAAADLLASGLERRTLPLAIGRLLKARGLMLEERYAEAQADLDATASLRAQPAFATQWRNAQFALWSATDQHDRVLEALEGSDEEHLMLFRLDFLAALDRWADYDAFDDTLRRFAEKGLSAPGRKQLSVTRAAAALRRGKPADARAQGVIDELLMGRYLLAKEERDEAQLVRLHEQALAGPAPNGEQVLIAVEALLSAGKHAEAAVRALGLARDVDDWNVRSIALSQATDAFLLDGDVEAGCARAKEAPTDNLLLSRTLLMRTRALRQRCRDVPGFRSEAK